MSSANGVLSSENMTVSVLPGRGVGSSKELKITEMKVIGNGSFGVVYSAKIEDDVRVAIKRVLQDKRFKNRELQIMKSLDHPNIVKLMYYFHKMNDEKEEYLNLVLEFFPLTIHQLTRNYAKQRQAFPIHYIKLYMFQLFRALNYLHCVGICHRDIKPQNLLVNTEKGLLQLCDFGSAKNLVKGEQNVSYICSRYYRAPELIFGSGDYTCAIDMWSAGTVVSELFLSQPIFPGDSGVDQLVEIIKVLGTPSREQIKAMNPNYQEFTFPQIRPHPWSKVFRSRVPNDGISLVSQLLCYIPQSRLSPAEACAHPFFDELRHVSDELSTYTVSELFNWSEQETANIPEELREKILNTVG